MEKIQDQDRLAALIHQWNQDHYDIFELSKPNENLEFHGVVRFYFQDGANVVTKCIRVASTATTKEVVDVLIEKFRPDMRMLTNNSYALYEVHVNGDERRLLDGERVLFVQLNWGKDVREGRFLLKQEGVPTISTYDKENAGKTFVRKLSKREKKEKKKQEKAKQKDHGGGLADKLYSDMPESKFTRSISNPEAVMKRRRQMKVEKKLQQCRGQAGQGGTLKIYGETLRPDVPYKTLLLSTGDDVEYVIKEALEKYDLDKEDPSDFCLFQVLVPPGEREYHGGAIGEERVMELHECPLAIAMSSPPSHGTVMFQLKRRPADAKKTKHKKIRAVSAEDVRYAKDERTPPNQLPYLIELNPDGSDNPKGKIYRLNMKFTEVGTDRNMLIQIHGPNVHPRHCVIGLTQSDGIVTATPNSPEAETIVNNQRIHETTTLRNGMTIRFGKLNVFKFIDPNFEEKMRRGQMPIEIQKRPMPQHSQQDGKMHETNFDLDGKVESIGSSSPRGSDRGPEPMEIQQRRPPPSQTSPRDAVDGRQTGAPPPRQEDALPAVLEFREDKEDGFLRSIILDVNSSGTQFKLAPTYTSYMAVRYCISGGYRPDMAPHDRAHRVTTLVNKISNFVHQAVQNNRDNPVTLAFWMANASEVLNFFKQDHDIHPFSLESQEILAESVQLAFHHLVNCLQYDLQRTMTAFLDENDAADDDEMGDDRQRYNAGKPTLGDVLDTLSSAMNLLRRCRVNAALTIQLFSQLFHYVNMWLFNVLVTERRVQFCTRSWGMRLKRRLGRVEAWAEKQGLELAADCHLCRIIQAAHLLEAPKSSADDITNICSTCFKLNSLQLRELLQQYIPEPNEPPIPQNLIDQVVRVAENMEDEKIKSDGRDVRLEEDPDLQLPFLLPEDGYSCDTIRGIPNGLGDFVEPLARAGLCRMVTQPGSSGEWTVYMTLDEGANMEQAIRRNQTNQQHQGGPLVDNKPQSPKEPEVVTITFNKVKGSMGLSIVAAKGDNQKDRGIYIKSVVAGGGADIDGRLQSGDQLLEVDGKNLVGLTQERAAELMTHTGQTVTLKVAKQGAFYHGLATQLSQPSPVMQRAATKKPSSPQANKHHPADEGPPPYTPDVMDRPRHGPPGGRREQQPLDKRLMFQNSTHSRSSPALNNDSVGPERRGPPSMPPSQQDRHHSRDPREMDPKSKSMANLHIEHPYDPQDPQQPMRPAASVGALQNSGQPFHDYYNQGDRRQDPRGHDYENHQNLESRMQKGPIDQTRNERSFAQNTLERHPPSSRNSNSSYRDERPQSAFFAQPSQRSDNSMERPHSMEINLNKVQEWQQKYGLDGGQNSPHNQSFENQGQNYMNTRPPYNTQQAAYVNQGDIPKLNANNEQFQPNFYENTVPRQNNNSPSFQQLRGPGNEYDSKSRSLPNVAAKPHVAPKPNTSKMPQVDIPKVEVDNRQTQPHFFDPRFQAVEQRSPRVSNPNFSASLSSMNTSYTDSHSPMRPIKKISPGRDSFQQHRSPELPPPPQDIPPELPPPPAIEDLADDMPPLPPPPIQEYPNPIDPQYANQGDAHINLNGPQPFQPYTSQHKQSMFQQPNSHDRRQDNPRNVGVTQPQRQQPLANKIPISPSHQRFQTNHDYQNITYDSKNQNRSFESSHQQSPIQSMYEQYDHRAQSLPENMTFSGLQQHMIQQNQMLIQQGKVRVVQEVQERTKDGKLVPSSPWDREEQEKQEKMKQEEIIRSRNDEIAFLEAKSYLSPQEQDRLRKLRFEQEFQRRVEEVANRGEDDEESDTEMTSSAQGREFLISTIRDDIEKAHKRMHDLETRHHFEEYEKEKDRKERLERKLEIFERERQERQQRLQKQQERKQREQEEYLRKQKELRDKQRQEYEENKRIHMQEAEKLQQRKDEELLRRKEMEREQLQRMQAQRDAEEAALRAEARKREEEFRREEMEKQREKERQEQREIRVQEERKRLEYLSNNSQTGYQPYANLPVQTQVDKGAPPPPQRGSSSYEMANQSFLNRSNNGIRSNDIQQNHLSNNNINTYRGMPMSRSHPGPDISAPPGIMPKKSVSFNTQPDTHLYTPHGSQSSYRTSSVSSDTNTPSYEQNSPLQHQNDMVFNNTPQQNHVEAKYRTSENTPGVIGAQEIYRDPRNRIAAQREATVPKKSGPERMSFRDKMKYFAQEAGENTPKEKPKASKTLRNIESQLHNGQ